MSNCSNIAKLILMIENPIYQHRLIISLLVSVLLSYFVIIKLVKVSKEVLVTLVIVSTFSLHQLIEFIISKFIDEERPYFESTEAIISMSDDVLSDPDKTDSTELGEVPQSTEKGSIRPGFTSSPNSLSYGY